MYGSSKTQIFQKFSIPSQNYQIDGQHFFFVMNIFLNDFQNQDWALKILKKRGKITNTVNLIMFFVKIVLNEQTNKFPNC